MKRTVRDVEVRLGPEKLQAREAAAAHEAAELDKVLALVQSGASRSDAIRAVLPAGRLASQVRRLRTYEQGGREALIDRRYGPSPPMKMTPAVRGGLRALATADPTASAEILAHRLSTAFGESLGTSTVQAALVSLDLARPRGRPVWRLTGVKLGTAKEESTVEPLALAGTELLKAVDEDIGAIAALTEAMTTRLAELPEPDAEIEDDRGDRDENGRFLPSYNAAEARTSPELGARFETVAARRAVKDLRAMRVVEESVETRHRKNLGLVMLPAVVRSPRWSELEHWRGQYLDEVAGFSYQASTLDKYLRELKMAGCSVPAREAVASFWLAEEGSATDKATGAVIVYADASTKPVWTHHWTRATKVSKTGRIQPAISTMSLHSGAGTPLFYRSYSGQASLPAEIPAFLAEYERHAGAGTVRRVVVMDREAHTVALFKSLAPNWSFVIPLRSQVVGPSARFEDVEPWMAYGDRGDEVCDAQLWLNDSRPGESALRIRVVGRRRHRTGKVAWFATSVPATEFTPQDVIRVYFDRWPAQEHVYRDGSGAVGLDVHHGYGKRKVDNLAVIDREEKLRSQMARLDTAIAKRRVAVQDLDDQERGWQEAYERRAPLVQHERAVFDAAMERGELTDEIRERYRLLRLWEGWIDKTRDHLAELARERAKLRELISDEEGARARKLADAARLSSHRHIFTVDVELDEIMTAFKFTFMNLCGVLMTEHLGVNYEIETLIDSVLTLPGERATTAEMETIRIFRQDRDAKVMAAVEQACASLTARGLRRGQRLLRFEMADAPGQKPRASAARRKSRSK